MNFGPIVQFTLKEEGFPGVDTSPDQELVAQAFQPVPKTFCFFRLFDLPQYLN
jgi:hypothetical protein